MNRYAHVLAPLPNREDWKGPELWRILQPFTELQRQGYVGIEWGFVNDDRIANFLGNFDAIILPRRLWPKEEIDKADKWFAALHKAHIAVIYELDDDMFSDEYLDRVMFMHDEDMEFAIERREMVLRAIQACDGMTVSNNVLKALAEKYVDFPVKVVPNYIDWNWFAKIRKVSKRLVPDNLSIGWSGGMRPDSDIEPMATAWGRIAQKYPDVIFVISGYHPQIFYDLVPNERIHLIDWMPIDQYPVGLMNIDIGCCPLYPSVFNVAKTPIKAMEYAAMDAAVVASPTLYSKIIENEVDGLIAETADEWEEALSRLIEDYRFRRDITKRLRRKVKKEHTLEGNAWRWIEAWTEIVEAYKMKGRKKIAIPTAREMAELGVRI